jgi:hypothetical protein
MKQRCAEGMIPTVAATVLHSRNDIRGGAIDSLDGLVTSDTTEAYRNPH